MTLTHSPRLLAGASLALLTFAASACRDGADGATDSVAQPVRIVVALTPARALPIDRTVDVVGTLRGDVDVTVSSKLAGRVETVLRDWGGAVNSGEPLVRLESIDLELARDAAAAAVNEAVSRLGIVALPGPDFDLNGVPSVRMARAELAHAAARLERSKSLLADPAQIVSIQDYEDLQNAHDVARERVDAELLAVRALIATAATRSAQLAAAEQRLADVVVRAPALTDGDEFTPAGGRRFRVAERMVEAGEYVKEGTPLFRLVVDDPLRYRVRVPERLAGEVAVGQDVTISSDAVAAPKSGRVVRVSPAADVATRTVMVEIQVANPDHSLVAGSFARGAIHVRRDPAVLFAPQDALVRAAGVTRVFTVENGVARGHEVETGLTVGDRVEIVRGLPGPVDLVTSGASRLATGTPVEVKDAAALGAPP